MKFINFLVVVLFSINVSATECKEAVTLINEGQKAECTGFLFSPDAEKSVPSIR